MKDSNPSKYKDSNSPCEQVDGELIHGETSVSPSTALDAIVERALQEASEQEGNSDPSDFSDLDAIDHERLYSDNFIRENENASRLLLLSFLGTALIGTSVFAWFVFSRPNREPNPVPPPQLSVPPSALPDPSQPNVSQPNISQPNLGQPNVGQPNVGQPNLNRDSSPAPFNPPDPSTQQPTFPVSPQNTSPPSPLPTPWTNPETPSLIPDGTVVPPPPQVDSNNPELTTP